MSSDTTLSLTGRIISVGAAGLDMVGALRGMPDPGESNPARIRLSFGGVARNVSENLARLGQPTHLVSVVGQDWVGRELLEHARLAGVDVSDCVLLEGVSTPAYLAVVDENGSRMLGLDDMSTLNRLNTSLLKKADAAIQSAGLIFMDANLTPAAIRSLVWTAKKNQIPLCADTTTTSLAERWRPHLADLTLLTANKEEARVLCPECPPVVDQATAQETARHLVNRGVGAVLISMAEFGVVYATSETVGHVPALRTKIVDSTGAGDALTATVLYGFMNHVPIDDAVRLGVTAASLTLRYAGSVVPDLSVEKLYEQLVI